MPTINGTRMSLSLTCNDLNRSIEFYKAVGFTVTHEWKSDSGELNGVMMAAGNAMIGLNQDDFAKGRDRKKGVGMSWYVETGDDIMALGKAVADAGVKLDSGPEKTTWGPVTFTVTDPDGFKLTVMSPM